MDATTDELAIGALYLAAVQSFTEFARTLTADDWSTPLPCTPGWTARDALSHVSGVPDDALAGRLDGVTTEPWTASQVERNRGFSVDELLERWSGQAATFGDVIESMGEHRPPFDCMTHEQDVRHGLGQPGNRDHAIVVDAASRLAAGFDDNKIRITVVLDDGRTFESGGGSDRAVTVRGLSPFEIFRSRLGRRTAEQVRSYDWSGHDDDIDEVVAAWFNFGPADHDIDE